MAMVYMAERTDLRQTEDEFLRDLEYGRLLVAVQWLGWFGRRQAYRQHRRDWLAEAFRLAGRVAES
jgi:hypothetical protein